jgi:hypothetical protein
MFFYSQSHHPALTAADAAGEDKGMKNIIRNLLTINF